MKKPVIACLLFFAVLFFQTNVVFAQAKKVGKKGSGPSGAQEQAVKPSGDGDAADYSVDPANPPEVSLGDARRIVLEILPGTYAFGDVYKTFRLDDGKLGPGFSTIGFVRESYGGAQTEYHNIPVESISAQVYHCQIRNAGTMYFVNSPHTARIFFKGRSGYQEREMKDHILAWNNLEDARLFCQAVYVLRQALAGQSVFTYFEQGRKYLTAGNREAARRDGWKHIQENDRLQMVFNEDNALEIFALCDSAACGQGVTNDIALAEAAERKGDALAAFNSCFRAYALANSNDPRLPELKERLIALYPRLKEKPGLPENCRRLKVQAEVAIKESNYWGGVNRLEQLLELAPWWPEGHYNIALLRAKINDNPYVMKQTRLTNYQSAIGHMKIFLKLFPDSANSRLGQDKIYEWEMRMEK